MGTGNLVTKPSQAVIGRYSGADDAALFIVGNGPDVEHRGNAFVVKEDGTGYFNNKKILVEGDTAKGIYWVDSVNPTIYQEFSSNGIFVTSGTSVGNPSFHLQGAGEDYSRPAITMSTANGGAITTPGTITAANYVTTSAGITEMYEWTDGNINDEDRRGLFITLDGNKIRVANENDTYILGVIDPNPSLIGDAAALEWKNKYIKDIFGSYIYQEVMIPEKLDDKGNIIEKATVRKQKVINPEYDETLEYVARTNRKEFAAITSKGKVVMIDDGTCVVNGYATVGANGIATYSNNNYAVRVLERIDENHIKVLIDSVFVI